MHLVQKQQVRDVCTDDLICFVKRQVNQGFDDAWGEKSNFAEPTWTDSTSFECKHNYLDLQHDCELVTKQCRQKY